MDQRQYNREQGQRKAEHRQTIRFQTDIVQWLERERLGKTLHPITLQFENGPWLYGDRDKPDFIGRIQRLEVEVGLFIEKLYQFATKERERSREKAWAFIGWPDQGSRAGYLHYHGFLIVSPTHYCPAGISFPDWFGRFRARCYQPHGVNEAVLSAPIEDSIATATFQRYAAKAGLAEPLWYKAGRNLPQLTWIETPGNSGFTVWTSRDFVIIGGKSGRGFRVKNNGIQCATEFARLSGAKAWCESQFDTSVTPVLV